MKKIISSKHLSTLIFILSIVIVVKLLWLVVSMVFLPTTGEEVETSSRGKKLYYRVRLTNESKVIAAIKTTAPKKNSSMRGYKLLGLYNSRDKIVVTIGKGSKTEILSKGESTKSGFKLIKAGKDFAIFKKNSEEFKLALENKRNAKAMQSLRNINPSVAKIKSKASSEIVEEDGIKHIPKNLLTTYTKDMDKIWKDIGLSQYKKNGNAAGFKVNFVKKGSDMEKLGIQRGDILTGVNGERLDLSSAMGFFNDIDNLENLTLTVLRNGKSKDLEYEIQ